MDSLVQELTGLIEIRRYLSETMGNPTQNRKTVTELNHSLLLLDKKIIELITSPQFKEYIRYEDVKEVVKAAVQATNIRSGMIKR